MFDPTPFLLTPQGHLTALCGKGWGCDVIGHMVMVSHVDTILPTQSRLQSRGVLLIINLDSVFCSDVLRRSPLQLPFFSRGSCVSSVILMFEDHRRCFRYGNTRINGSCFPYSTTLGCGRREAASGRFVFTSVLELDFEDLAAFVD